jgi:hypothetical protein
MPERSTGTPRIARPTALGDGASHRRPERARIRRLAQITDALVHDARAPLTVIQEYAALMREELFGRCTEEQQRVLDVIADRGSDLGRVIDNAVDANRLALRSFRLWGRPRRVPALVSRVRTTLERKAAIRQTDLKFVMSDATPEIYCDEDVAARALVNIGCAVLNACGDASRITVAQYVDFEQREAGIRLDVEAAESDLVATLFRDLAEHATVDGNDRAAELVEPHLSAELIHRNFGRIESGPAEAGRATLWVGFAVADPVEVVRRHLVRVTNPRPSYPHVSLLRAEFDAPTGEHSSRDVGGLLKSCLGRDDLALELDHNHWLVTLVRRQTDAERFELLVDHRRKTVNRRRLGHSLPRISLHVIGACQSSVDIPRLLTMIEGLPARAP